MEKKRRSKRSRRKEERKAILDKLPSGPDVEATRDQMMFYENGLDRRWFYHDWVKAGRPKE